MTYCVGLLLEQGLVFASDTRTNAGVDQVAISPKMHVFEVENDRVIVLMTAGNLAITQSVARYLKATIERNLENSKHLHNAESLFEAAGLVGAELRAAFERDAEYLKNHNIDFSANILLGGQIGETKYGKLIIDRVVKYNTEMMDAVKCVLISFDPYYAEIRKGWGDGLKKVFSALPSPDWC